MRKDEVSACSSRMASRILGDYLQYFGVIFCAKIVGALGDGLADTLAASDGSIHLWLPAGTAASPNFGAGSTLACACESGAADPAVFPFEETLSTDVNGASSAFFSRSSFAFASS